jgi:ATP-dependent RNA helicase DeaD
MDDTGFSDVLEPALAQALEERGFTALTPVQLAVLDPAASGRDLRITSQTGSGKTVAIGLVVRPLLEDRKGTPTVLMIAPTRELARQVQEELSWLFASIGVKVAAVTGGSSIRDELRALAARPDIVVGTPGRLIDHLERGTLDLSAVRAVVLDEADRMLDLGFREELESILARAPEERRTHLVSATFPEDVRGLADRAQRDPLHLEGTRLGAANSDIEHVIHVIDPRQKLDAIVNLLLAHSDARTLVFARTRADVAEIAELLAEIGFAVTALSGEMQQRERTRALDAFKRGSLRVLVATDVAARGLDVPEVTLVIHVAPPTDADGYTHRSGRTGRAGRKGTSALLVAPRELPGVRRVLGRARVRSRMEPIPTADAIRRAEDERVFASLTAEEGDEIDPRSAALARRLVESGDAERTLARLLARTAGGIEPREIRTFEERPPMRQPRAAWAPPQAVRSPRPVLREEGIAPTRLRAMRDDPRDRADLPRADVTPRAHAPRAPGSRPRIAHGRDDHSRDDHSRIAHGRADHSRIAHGRDDHSRDDHSRDRHSREWTLFHVTWGERHGADPRRLLAMVCRRGQIASHAVGGIRVGPTSSEIQIAPEVAQTFAEATRRPDPRDPRVRIVPHVVPHSG